MIILGIDPGTATTGFGVIKKIDKTNNFEVVDYGVINTNKNLTDAQRLLILSTDLKQLIKKFKPERVGIEKLFFTSNQKTAMTVSQARGVCLLTLEEKKLETIEFTPLQVRSTLCGYGKATKQQVQSMVKQTFNMKSLPKPDDAADALAIALCAGLRRLDK